MKAYQQALTIILIKGIQLLVEVYIILLKTLMKTYQQALTINLIN
jgi:hypothetical protein